MNDDNDWREEEEQSRYEKETRKVVLWQQDRKTDKAYLFSDFPQNDPKRKDIWIPRSIIHHISREPANLGEWPQCLVEVEEWFLDKLGL